MNNLLLSFRLTVRMSVTLCLMVLTGAACTSQQSASEGKPLRHASLLRLSEGEGYKQIEVRNPWDTTQCLQTYILVPWQDSLPTALPEGTVIRTPVKTAAVFTSVHCGLLADLQQTDAIVGVCDAAYIMKDEVRQRLTVGRIADLGSAALPDMERLIALSPQVVLLSPFKGSNGYGALGAAGIPLIECADYMETSALGRAEWIRFYGLLFGCETLADSLFADTEARYDTLVSLVQKTAQSPVIIPDMPLSGTWYVPGGQSTMGRLFADAGMTYPWSNNADNGSVPMGIEQMLAQVGAEVWIIKYYQADNDLTYAQLARDVSVASQFKAWKDRRIFGCNTAVVPFYDEAPFRPDRLLHDLVRIAHPHLPVADTLYYYKPLP